MEELITIKGKFKPRERAIPLLIAFLLIGLVVSATDGCGQKYRGIDLVERLITARYAIEGYVADLAAIKNAYENGQINKEQAEKRIDRLRSSRFGLMLELQADEIRDHLQPKNENLRQAWGATEAARNQIYFMTQFYDHLLFGTGVKPFTPKGVEYRPDQSNVKHFYKGASDTILTNDEVEALFQEQINQNLDVAQNAIDQYLKK